MATNLSFSYSYLPALSPVSTTPNSLKPISKLVLSVRFFNKPIKLVGHAHQVRKLAIVTRYRSGYRRGLEIDDEMWLEEGDEEEIPIREDDPNLDLDRIESSTVRLLDEQNNMIGVMPIREAIRRAEKTDLVLAIVSAEADPPVLRLFEEENYKKHKFEKQKKQKVQQRKAAARTKELKMGYRIDQHDYSVKQKQATKFLREGHKVKVIVILRGRDSQYKDEAIALLRQFQNDLGQLASEESKNFADRNVYMVLMPNKANIQREQQLKQKEEQLKKKQVEASTEEQVEKEEADDSEEAENSTSTEEISANV